MVEQFGSAEDFRSELELAITVLTAIFNSAHKTVAYTETV